MFRKLCVSWKDGNDAMWFLWPLTFCFWWKLLLFGVWLCLCSIYSLSTQHWTRSKYRRRLESHWYKHNTIVAIPYTNLSRIMPSRHMIRIWSECVRFITECSVRYSVLFITGVFFYPLETRNTLLCGWNFERTHPNALTINKTKAQISFKYTMTLLL